MHSYGELEGHQPQISIVIHLNKCIHIYIYVYTCSQASIHAQLMLDFHGKSTGMRDSLQFELFCPQGSKSLSRYPIYIGIQTVALESTEIIKLV